jgi:hypothetical protein
LPSGVSFVDLHQVQSWLTAIEHVSRVSREFKGFAEINMFKFNRNLFVSFFTISSNENFLRYPFKFHLRIRESLPSFDGNLISATGISLIIDHNLGCTSLAV